MRVLHFGHLIGDWNISVDLCIPRYKVCRVSEEKGSVRTAVVEGGGCAGFGAAYALTKLGLA